MVQRGIPGNAARDCDGSASEAFFQDRHDIFVLCITAQDPGFHFPGQRDHFKGAKIAAALQFLQHIVLILRDHRNRRLLVYGVEKFPAVSGGTEDIGVPGRKISRNLLNVEIVFAIC